MMWTAPRRLYVNADRSKVVDEGDPEAAALLVGAGGQIEEAEAERLGLLDKKAQAKAPATKQVDHPPENKGQRR
jgi:hypothetical protein